ncbi:hypothetical protein ABZZ20_31770 [Streptomyces sp. NPDC006430]|uniref:hypothetical protein n=1 Tax=Streptomyces sp. NPDC006430 TaxID=3154299 RepID=UPI0033BC95BE
MHDIHSEWTTSSVLMQCFGAVEAQVPRQRQAPPQPQPADLIGVTARAEHTSSRGDELPADVRVVGVGQRVVAVYFVESFREPPLQVRLRHRAASTFTGTGLFPVLESERYWPDVSALIEPSEGEGLVC